MDSRRLAKQLHLAAFLFAFSDVGIGADPPMSAPRDDTSSVRIYAGSKPSEPISQRPDPPLVEAAKRGDRAGLERHFPAATDYYRRNALFYAALAGQLGSIEWLLDHGVPPTGSALEGASRKPHLAAIKLLCRRGANPNEPNRYGVTPLHDAIDSEHPERVPAAKALLRCGGDPKIPSPKSGWTSPVLGGAALLGDVELVDMLLAGGANVNQPTTHESRQTPLMRAWPHPAVVALLLERGADPKARDGYGQTALTYAACEDHFRGQLQPESVRLLIEAGSPVNDPEHDNHGERNSPLQCAVRRGSVDAVRRLLAAGADPNYVDGKGRTALGYIALADDNPNKKHADVRDLSDAELDRRHVVMIEALLAHGAQADLDPKVAELAKAGEPVSNTLLRGLEGTFLGDARNCIKRRPRTLSRVALPSPPAAAAASGAFTAARVVRIHGDLAKMEQIGISPDGRWLLAGLKPPTGGAAETALYATQADQWFTLPLKHDYYADAEWSERPPALRLRPLQDRSVHPFDLSGSEPGARPVPNFARVRAGDQPCLRRDKAGNPMSPTSRGFGNPFRLDDEPVWSPTQRIRYEVVKQDSLHWALVATRDGQTETLVVHDLEWVLRAWRQWRDEMLQEFREIAAGEPGIDTTELNKMIKVDDVVEAELLGEDYTLSLTGQYLYYRIGSRGGGWFGPPGVRRDFIVDVISRPARVWEIHEPVGLPTWHPNGRELYFVTHDSAVGGRRERETKQRSSLVVVQLP